MHPINGQTKNFIDQPYIETSAHVDTFVVPDRIFLSILISESDTRGKQSVEELEIQMSNKLNEIGIDLSSQLSLSDLTSNFKKYFIRKPNILKSKSYELLVYEARTAGQVIYELEGIGLSNVDIVRTEHSRIEELKLALKTEAVTKAKMHAIAMAAAVNQSLGPAIFLSDGSTEIVNMLEGKVTGIRIRGSSSIGQEYIGIPVEFEKIHVSSSVQVKFAFEN